MNFKAKLTPEFERAIKQIAKKHRGIKSDILKLIADIEIDPTIGTSLGNNLYKVRLSLSGNNKGKSGGARVITYVKIIDETVILTQIYLKSEYDTVDEKVILKNLSENGFI